MKTLFKIVVGVLVLLTVLVVVAIQMLDSGAKAGIETIMTERLGVATTLDDINISLFDSNCELSGFKIENPEGYSDKPFFGMGRGFVAVSGTTLMDDVVEIPKLELTGIRVNLEQSGMKGNYEKILEALSKGESPSESDDGQKRFIVREIIVSDTIVTAQMLPTGNILGALAPPVTLKIPEIRLKDVGSESGKGALLSDVASQVMSAVFVQIGDGAGQLPGAIGKGFTGALKQLPNLQELSGRLSGGFEKDFNSLLEKDLNTPIGKEVEKLGDGLKKGLSDLLGK
ncbi:MAG: hypothetical protein ACI97A_000394 [Planctomycetota bacterium]|jgi:hypothetical protein